MGIGTAANTHRMFRTINHVHLDTLVNWALNRFPEAVLNLVECEDGRWFVEVDHGVLYDGMPGVSRPNVAPYEQPLFHDNEQGAQVFAIACIKQAHPELANRDDLFSWFDDDA